MKMFQMFGRADAEGVLRLECPGMMPEGEYEVVVVVQPRPGQTDAKGWPVGFFERTLGAWEGEFERPPQGEFEKREEL